MVELAVAKAATVATSKALAASLRRALGADGGVAVESTIALCIDFSCGKKRAVAKGKSLGKRLNAVAARRRRLTMVAKVCKGTGGINKLVRGGIAPAALYGACVTGLSDAQLLRLRRTAAAGTVPRAQGRSLDVALQLSGLDLVARATGAQMVRWAKEVWNATGCLDKRALSIPVIRDAWNSVAQIPPTTWAPIADPMGAAMLSGQRLGWTMTQPFEWRTDEGYTLLLGQDAPALVQWHVEQSAQRLVERRVADKCATVELAGRRANLGFIRHLLHSKAKNAMSDDDKCALRVVAANGWWPRQRQADAGYPVDPYCEKCGAGFPDTVHHRAWCCQWAEAVEKRREIATLELILEAQLNPESPMFTRGIRPHPADCDKVVASQQCTSFWRNGEVELDRQA